MKEKSFTLVEFLLVLAIIGTLAAFIVPSLGRAREKAKLIICTNNLRQIGVAIHMYANDNYSKLPPVEEGNNTWIDLLAPYIDNTGSFDCPNYQGIDSYGFNYKGLNIGLGNNVYEGIAIDSIEDTSQLVMISEGNKYRIINGQAGPPPFFMVNSEWLWPRHFNGVNVLFVDGSVQWYSMGEVSLLNWE